MSVLDDCLSFRNGRAVKAYSQVGNDVWGSNGVIGSTEAANASAGDIVIGRVGAFCGSLYLLTSDSWVTDNAIVASPKSGFDSQFVYYVLTTLPLREHAGGSAQPLLNQTVLRSVECGELPDLPIQRRIAEILGRLDDKIEVNRRINRTLEAMAQALYRHWFVDFAPFQAGEFVESAVGLAPRGWEVGRVEDVLELAYGKGLTEQNRVPGPFAVVGSSGIVGCHAQALVKGPGIVVGRKGTIGRLTWVADDFWPIDTTYYVVPRRDTIGLEFIYHLLGSLDLPSRNNDSAVPGLNRNEVYRLPVVVPPDQVLLKYRRIVQRWFDMMNQCSIENAHLAATRDYLLPRLLAGEVEV